MFVKFGELEGLLVTSTTANCIGSKHTNCLRSIPLQDYYIGRNISAQASNNNEKI